MFAYYFPPLGGGGVQRTAKYVKYLPSEGFEPIVVTGSQRGFMLRDASLSADVPSGTVIRRARALPLQTAQWKLDGLLRRAGLPTKLVNEVLWPDAHIGWLPGAVLGGLRAVRDHQPDVIYSTSSPTTAHLAALIVHNLTGIPWVADFRDSWLFNPLDPRTGSYPPLTRASEALERKIVAEASYVTFADETMEACGLGTDDPRRVVICNGVDPDDLPPVGSHPAPSTDRFRLSYVGSFYGSHDGAETFAAIRDLMERGELDPRTFELRIVGHAEVERDKLDSLPVSFTGYVNHDQALAEMAGASALLYSRPPGDRVLSGKIFEYLTSGRPVLSVAHPDSLASRLVRELGAGWCADVRDPRAVAEALREALTDWRRGAIGLDPGVREEVLRRYSRRKLAGELAEVLRATVDAGATAASTPTGTAPAAPAAPATQAPAPSASLAPA
ncbi:MAG TPA: glycosyltransferase family 4 protein [Solirubrobacteraceae bacterium]|nr:glycosyltransferase family 4 protein [Solirubrobacteraceae bacterium]